MTEQTNLAPTIGGEIGRTKARVQNLERALGDRPGLDHVVVSGGYAGSFSTFIGANSTLWFPTYGVRFYELFASRVTPTGTMTVTLERNGTTIATLEMADGEETGKVAVTDGVVLLSQYVSFSVLATAGDGLGVQARGRSRGQDSGAVDFSVYGAPT